MRTHAEKDWFLLADIVRIAFLPAPILLQPSLVAKIWPSLSCWAQNRKRSFLLMSSSRSSFTWVVEVVTHFYPSLEKVRGGYAVLLLVGGKRLLYTGHKWGNSSVFSAAFCRNHSKGWCQSSRWLCRVCYTPRRQIAREAMAKNGKWRNLDGFKGVSQVREIPRTTRGRDESAVRVRKKRQNEA